ncbi:YdcF family protein [Limobrevibacterium gyesilva]|uniref:YdcF family protein n=1 Tax=Limobrevibacterium gyesilva TaxID=2991712 RepID=A0AA42CFA6_9PROT|nr:YdcF family protein [Limobrevibacterium gyesilva]MCW3476988.1 YdcF family protein [Limobrevibacterium gyesilva]
MQEVETVIVIFGAAVRADGTPSTALRRRVLAAQAFGRYQRTPLYVATGGVGRHGPSEALVMARLLRELGVPDEQIVLDETATDTVSSVRAVTRLLRERGYRGPVYAATSAYHMPRCVVLLLLARLDAWAGPAASGPAARGLVKRWYWRLREAAALPADALLMLWLRLRGQV